MSSRSFGSEWITAASRLSGFALTGRLGLRLTGCGSRCTGLQHEFLPWWSHDADSARELYGGHFVLAGHGVRCRPHLVFDQAHPQPDWTRELHGFRWLGHLCGNGLGLYRTFARGLVSKWMTCSVRPCRGTDTVRLVSLTCYAGALLKESSAEFEALFLRGMSREVRRALRAKPRDAVGKLDLCLALLMASLAFSGLEGLRPAMLARACTLLDDVILADGGHRNRNNRDLASLVEMLWRIRSAMEALRLVMPDPLAAALDRGSAMVRLLTLGDGRLAGFGVGAGPAPECSKVQKYPAEPERLAVQVARQSGYVRLEQGRSVVLLDGGSGAGHHGLGFEWSYGPLRMIVSCGCPVAADGRWTAAAQSVSAHSGLDARWPDGCDSNRAGWFGGAKTGVWSMAFRSAWTAVGALGVARLARTGGGPLASHERFLFLAFDGVDLRGQDDIEVAAGGEAEFAVRFHLHPDVTVEVSRRPDEILLKAADGSFWEFAARGHPVSLEESVHFAAGEAGRRSSQIVVRGHAHGTASVRWAFRKRLASS